MNRRPSIARRIAWIAATTTAVTAAVSAAVPLVLLGLRLNAADRRTAENLAAAVEAGIERERAEEPTLAKAASDVLDESALDGVRLEVWGRAGLLAARGPGAEVGRGGDVPDAEPYRRKGRLVVHRRNPAGFVVAVAVPVSLSRALRREMAWALLLGVVPLSVLAALVSARLARKALAPLESLATEVAARPAGGPWEPIAVGSADAEIERVAKALNELGERLTQALAAEREFASYAAHALRTPLTRLAAEARRGTPPTGGALETLRRLVESLLLLARTDARLAQTGVTVNVADVLRQVAASRAPGRDAVTVNAPDEVLVRGDDELLAAAVEHLVENALAYGPPGGPVRLSAAEEDGIVTVAVRDVGPGIDPDERERIFEPFVRGRGSAGSDGSGLGLALVRRVAMGHGGTVRAVPEGGGTRFEILLPAWRPR